MKKIKLATVWLAGCSGCHMSFLDMDEWLLELAQKVDIVYSPIADIKDYPEGVDVCLVEGAIANEENLALIKEIRQKTK
ncbi:MAG: oxidoreductase, partial [Crocosphaera sp.]